MLGRRTNRVIATVWFLWVTVIYIGAGLSPDSDFSFGYLLTVIFLILLKFRSQVQAAFARWSWPPRLKFLLVGLLFGALVEITVGLGPGGLEGKSWSTNPAWNLIVGLGYYLPLFYIWSLLLRRYPFTLTQVYVIGAAYGVLTEKFGQQFLAVLSNPVFGVVFIIPFLGSLYGALIAGPYLLVGWQLQKAQPDIKSETKHPFLRTVLLPFLLALFVPILTFICLFIWFIILRLIFPTIPLYQG